MSWYKISATGAEEMSIGELHYLRVKYVRELDKWDATVDGARVGLYDTKKEAKEASEIEFRRYIDELLSIPYVASIK